MIRRLAEQLGVHHEALRNWIRQDEADRGERDDRRTTDMAEENRRLRREVVELRRANEILKAASAYFAAELDPRPRRVRDLSGSSGLVIGVGGGVPWTGRSARINPDDLAATGCAYLTDLADGRATVRGDVPDEREARRTRASTASAAVQNAAARDARRPRAYALDGKRLAGARRRDGSRVHLLSMVTHDTGATIAQREIGAKTNEIPEARTLLADVDVAGAVLTLDALHTQRGTAEAIVTDHHASYVLSIKANQPNLLTAAVAASPRRTRSSKPPAVTPVTPPPDTAGSNAVTSAPPTPPASTSPTPRSSSRSLSGWLDAHGDRIEVRSKSGHRSSRS